MKSRKIPLLCAASAMAVLILDSRGSLRFASDAIELCIRTVIPSLFPFFVLSIYLTGNLGSKSAKAAVITAGFLGGYPVGAQAAAEAYENGQLTKAQADKLLMFCSQAGPSFLFGMVASQFPHLRYGWMLWAVQLCSAATVALISGQDTSPSPVIHSPATTLAQAMKKATQAMASVCGWVVLFRILTGHLGRLSMADGLYILLSGFAELTNGSLLLGQITDVSSRFLIAALILNFGGICVLLQTASVARGLDLRRYLTGKALQTFFSLCYGLCFIGIFWGTLPVFLAVFMYFLRNLRNNSSIPARIGV